VIQPLFGWPPHEHITTDPLRSIGTARIAQYRSLLIALAILLFYALVPVSLGIHLWSNGWTFSGVVLALMVAAIALRCGIVGVSDIFRDVRNHYGTIDPRGWLDHDNAYGFLIGNRPIDELETLCGDLCIGRWRIGERYVFVQNKSDAATLRLVMH